MALRQYILLVPCVIIIVGSSLPHDESIANICKMKDKCDNGVDSNESFTYRNCRCDSDCYQYGDCCKGIYSSHRKNWNFVRQYHCVKIKSMYKNQAYFMVTKCASSWPEGQIRQRCQKPHPNAAFFSSVPVTDKQDMKTFRNIYCAICNGLSVDDIVFWQLKILCVTHDYNNASEAQKDIRYNSDNHQWEIKINRDQSELIDLCQVQILPPDHLHILRECHYDLITTCPSTWKKKLIKRACHKHTAVRYFGSLSFKNRYCAKCHGIEESDLTCPHLLELVTDDNQVQSKLWGLSSPKFLSYTIFMHSLINNGHLKVLCPEGQIQTPTGQCEEFSCSQDSVWKNGECVEV